MYKTRKQLDRSLNDVYYDQDASDMFFNHEGVIEAYKKHNEGMLTNAEEFAKTIAKHMGVSYNDAKLIADDFLQRL